MFIPVSDFEELHARVRYWQGQYDLLQGELAAAKVLPDQLLAAIRWNEEQRDIQAKEIERLQGLLDHAIEVMNDGTMGAGMLLAENRQLKEEIARLRVVIQAALVEVRSIDTRGREPAASFKLRALDILEDAVGR